MLTRIRNKKSKPSGRKVLNAPNPKSERIVVDEIFENNTVRILRAKRRAGFPNDNLKNESWEKEREDFLLKYQIEAFVGFRSPQKLKEGDVFFIVDGSKLNSDYKKDKILPRDRAKKIHLIVDREESLEQARKEIKREFYELTVAQVVTDEKEKARCGETIEQKLREE